MKRFFLIGAFLTGLASTHAQTFREWQDPQANAVNRAPIHSKFFAYESTEAAAEAVKEKSDNFMTLNGVWKFRWVKSYIRPQENGTKTDIRWWRQLNISGNGLQFTSDAPISASALHYTSESLDEGMEKQQGHSEEVEKADLTNVLIDKAQMGLACIDSWSAVPEPEFMLPYGDYEFTFIMMPVQSKFVIR